LTKAGAVVRRLAASLAAVETADGDYLEPDATFETMPSVLFDAVIIPDGERSATEFASLGQAVEFLKDQYRHCKPILLLGAGEGLAVEAGVPVDDEADWALVRDSKAFAVAVARHRNWDRATDPPLV
jgi:catalase